MSGGIEGYRSPLKESITKMQGIGGELEIWKGRGEEEKRREEKRGG